MTNASHAWGSAPSKRFDDYEVLRKAGFSRLRLPEKFGGLGLMLPELFGLIIELAQADPTSPMLTAATRHGGAHRLSQTGEALSPAP